MKNIIKIVAVSSLLIIASLLVSACGGDTEDFVQGKGQVDIYVTGKITGLPLENVEIVVRENNASGDIVGGTALTNSKGFYQWVSPTAGVATDYYFTFTLAGYTTQTTTARPNLTGSNVRLDIKMPLFGL